MYLNKSCSVLYSEALIKNGQDFFDTVIILVNKVLIRSVKIWICIVATYSLNDNSEECVIGF